MILQKLKNRNELFVVLVLLLFAVLIQMKSGQFFTANNLVDMARSIVVPGIMACGLLIVIASGNIDVSFPYIGMLCMFFITNLLSEMNYSGPVILAFFLASLLGAILGLINGLLSAWMKLPTLIITLGTCTIFTGFTQGVLKSHVISALPEPLEKMSKTNLFVVSDTSSGLSSSMPVSILILLFVMLIVHFILRYTMLGRGVYAVGGDPVAAERAGFNVALIRIFVFTFCGMLGGIAGLTQVTVSGMCQINFFDGYEMTVIAAVVLGGASISGGNGNVLGTILGVIMMKIIHNNLILLGIPTSWSKLMTGVLIIVGVSMTAYKQVLAQKRVASKVLTDHEEGVKHEEGI